jgi:hypothetical protein
MTQNRKRLLTIGAASATAIILIVVGLILGAHQGGQSPTVAMPSPTTITSVVSASTADSPSATAKLQTPIDYLNDPSRTQSLKPLYDRDSVGIATELQSGHFGPVIKTSGPNDVFTNGYVGWGTISAQTLTPGATAEVYFRQDGSIDFNKGVRSFGVDTTSASLQASAQGEGYPYKFTLYYTGDAFTRVTALSAVSGASAQYHYVTDVVGLGQLDADAAGVLETAANPAKN